MHISIIEAQRQLADLVRSAEAGEEVILTVDGHEAVRLVGVRRPTTREERLQFLTRLQESAASSILPGPGAARSQDFLYDEDGLPG